MQWGQDEEERQAGVAGGIGLLDFGPIPTGHTEGPHQYIMKTFLMKVRKMSLPHFK